MGLKAGIVGLPNVGKSTLFNAITNSQVEAANYPFATIEPNVGIVNLNDTRLDKLAEIVKPKKILPATFEFFDIAGLVEGASKGEGLGNKFLANIRESDAIIQVVRCFEDENITHVSGDISPVRDVEIINLELLLSDLETIQKIMHRTKKKASSADKFAKMEYDVAAKIKVELEKEVPARNITLSKEELFVAKQYNLLTLKPVLYVANLAEECAADPSSSKYYLALAEKAKKENAEIIGISIQIEQEISQLDEEDKIMFLDDLGLIESGLSRLTHAAFKLLNLSTYFTAGVQEVRAWVFKNGMSAPQCAGIIHTDFEKGFIRAEVIAYEDYINNHGEHGAKEAGKARLEGKTYVMKDGDVCHFRFNV